MASSSEKSFGARLFRANSLNSYITNFAGYAPARPQETAAEFGALLGSILAANNAEALAKQTYNTAVTTRYAAFRADTNSVFKLLPNIRAAVEAQYGKNSLEFKQIDTIVKHIRETKLVRVAATDTTPETTVSRSEQSYGSTTQYFNNLISNLTQLVGYAPSNPAIQVAGLQAFAAQINTLNTQVTTAYQVLRLARIARNEAYADLSDRAARIKAYVKAQYGTQSQEFMLIKGLSI
jgi:hypothetical protein